LGYRARPTCLGCRACLTRFGSWACPTRLCRGACSISLDHLVGRARMGHRTSLAYLVHLGRLGSIDTSNIEE